MYYVQYSYNWIDLAPVRMKKKMMLGEMKVAKQLQARPDGFPENPALDEGSLQAVEQGEEAKEDLKVEDTSDTKPEPANTSEDEEGKESKDKLDGEVVSAAPTEREVTKQSSQEKKPPRPPPPKIFGAEDDPARPVELPPAPEDAPEVKVGKRNPKLYQLVAMSQENASCSFWWDSVDASAIKEEEDMSLFSASFEDSVSVRVVQDDDDEDEG